MKALIIGFGSIGKRHFNILSGFNEITSIDVVTKQSLAQITHFSKLTEIKNLNIYDYFIISSETIKHFEQLNYICSKVENKKILVEKPLYDKSHKDIKTTNQIFTAYNLRFHPIIEKINHLLQTEKVYYANIICGQYLPSWRAGQDYTQSYSADINQGGGVLRDLSHELDYSRWLFGDFEEIKYINSKLSDLAINSDDIFTAIAVTKNRTIVNLSIDYISKIAMRKIIIHTQNITIEADIINNTLVTADKGLNKTIIEVEKIDSNYTYLKMHKAIITNNLEVICSYDEANKIMDTIENITYKEL